MTDTDAAFTGDFKTRFGQWMFSQGTSTVLLFAILVGLWYGVPEMLARHDESLGAQRKEFLEAMAQRRIEFLGAMEDQRRDFKEVMDKCCRDRDQRPIN